MASAYPDALDVFSNPAAGTLMNDPAYLHNTQHADANDAIEKMQLEFGTLPKGNYADVKARIRALGHSGWLTVASSNLTADMQNACNYKCDGTDDQVQINNALKAASRIADGFTGAEGWVGVLLVGDEFTVGNNGDPITMYPNTALRGCGDGTLVRSAFGGGSVKGVIELLSTLVSRCAVSDMSIGHPTSGFNGSGIKFDGTGDNGDSYGFNTGGDAFIKIRRVGIYNPIQKGIWMIDGREVQIDNVHVQNARQHGVFLDNHSDGKLHRIVANGNAGLQAGIHLTGGNSQISDCKVFYRGNGSSNTAQHGFYVNTSRLTMGNCQAQDNGGYGFYLEGADHSVANCMADSNSAQDPAMGGFFIGASGSYSGLVATDRAQLGSPYNQDRGIVFSGSPQVYLTGRADVDAGSDHVVNAPGANSFVRVVRAGTTLHSVG